ncbi:hypothetical protein ACFV0H_25005 [Streptomyces erythrochromogenes]|uniref:Uncharacterized protein n=1 Tax=Streptomyces erythrochromogenes TaxID=285574 RepID=A0ABZ1QM04_9ACTN|nr:hypothetical protein [Streptomyces erythrochromogenes]MCX5589111.1 hypothetical protein [Streptomyces erythrochromogenes]
MNVAETLALALLVTTVVSVVVIDVFRARMRLPGPGAERGNGEPSDGRPPTVPAARHRQVSATPTGGDEQLWGSV